MKHHGHIWRNADPDSGDVYCRNCGDSPAQARGDICPAAVNLTTNTHPERTTTP